MTRFVKTLFALCALPFFAYSQNLGVVSVLKPLANTCVTDYNNDSIVVRIINLGSQPESNFTVSYAINNGVPVTETIAGPLGAGNTIDYRFTSLFPKAQGVNDIKVYTSLPGESIATRGNDTGTVRIVTKIRNYPYYENFENNSGGYTPNGPSSSWGWGSPNKALMKPGEGNRSWYNGFNTPDTYYLPSDGSFLNFPCFDFTNLKSPLISFKFFLEIEFGYESVVLEASTNGVNFTPVGTGGEANSCNTLNWFNSGTTWAGNSRSYPCSFGWGGGCPGNICGKWVTVKHCLDPSLVGQPNVYFRLRFVSTGTACQAEGIGLDSVFIGEAPAPPFSFNASDACANMPMSFTPVLDPCITSTRWSFGDNSPVISAPLAFHAYKNPGTYQAKLIVTSYCGKLDTFTKTVTVLPPPAITLVPGTVDSKYCLTASAVTLTGSRTPSGGTFTINGSPATTFDPAALGIGKHRVVYTYTEPSGNQCTNRDTQIVEVYLPEVRIDSLGGSYCLASPDVRLRGTPLAGVFTVNGVVDSFFRPSALGLGQYLVTYSYTDPLGCTGTESRLVDVVSNIVAQISGLNPSYCAYEPPVTLTGSPSGGIFTVDGSVASVLNPATLTAGTHRVIYSYSDGGSCGDKDTFDLSVIKVTAAFASLDSVFCFSAPVIPLNGKATPAGGLFRINGNPAVNINPTALAVGNHQAAYIYADPVSSCVDTARQTFRIDKPLPTLPAIDDSYCKDHPVVVLAGVPAGGTFTLNGNTITSLDPAALDTIVHSLVYTYTKMLPVNPAVACSNTITKNVRIAPLPTAAFSNLDPTYCITSNLVPLNANPSGGAFTINSLPVQMLDPSLLGVGTHEVGYQYVEQNFGCVVNIKQNVQIVAPPAVSISGIRSSYCISDTAFYPVGNPAGGTFKLNNTNINPVVVNPALLAAGQHKLSYSFSAANGCDADIDQLFDIRPKPAGAISPDPVTICKDQQATLTYSGSEPITWSTGAKSKSIKVSPQASAFYWIKADECIAFYDTADVIVVHNPSALFSLEPEDGLIPLTVKATALFPEKNMTWVFDFRDSVKNSNPVEHLFELPGTHIITLITDTAGCIDTLTKLITAREKTAPITLPNVFTPDKDGINDDFGMNKDARRFVTQLSFQVYNRWGTTIFSSSDPYVRWDGTDKGADAPDGVYFYLLNATLSDNSSYNLTGSVTLIRN